MELAELEQQERMVVPVELRHKVELQVLIMVVVAVVVDQMELVLQVVLVEY